MAGVWLAQLNVAALRGPLDAPELTGFLASIAPINALAERAPGFIWRLVDDLHAVADFEGYHVIVNMSVWSSVADLVTFTYGVVQHPSPHREVMSRRREWFGKMKGYHQVLWWVPEGHRPTVAEGLERLADLRANGPSDRAFDFRSERPAPATP